MPYYTAKCLGCKKVFQYISTIAKRNEPVKCECGWVANRDIEEELAPGPMVKLVAGNERWSLSMGVPVSQIEKFKKLYPGSTYDSKGRLLIKDRKDKLRQAKERGFVEL